jgi:hypothetical protein
VVKITVYGAEGIEVSMGTRSEISKINAEHSNTPGEVTYVFQILNQERHWLRFESEIDSASGFTPCKYFSASISIQRLSFLAS